MNNFNPGDVVSFFANGKQLKGRVVEATLWRRLEMDGLPPEVAYKIQRGKDTFWRTQDRVKA